MELQVFGLKLKRQVEDTDWAVRETYVSKKKLKWDTNKISKYEFVKEANILCATHFSIGSEPLYFDKQEGIRVKGDNVHSDEIPEIPTGSSDLLPGTICSTGSKVRYSISSF